VVATLVLGLGLAAGAPAADLAGKLIVFHAGSLAVPMQAMEKEFEAMHPGLDVLREAGGSTQLARMITEVGKPADIMASADYEVIDKNLIPKHAALNIYFASNELVLCYTPKSRYAGEVTADNWPEILQRKDVVWGHSDPNLDPCGYRSLMVMQLAEKFYGKPGLYERLLANRPQQNVRPKSVELIALLESGNMDYAWEYISVAKQHGLKHVALDDRINLGNYKNDDFYGQAKVTVTGKQPGTFNELSGSSCTYGVTLINASPNRAAAEAFLAYMLDPAKGLRILEEAGQPTLRPARVPSKAMKDALPAALQGLVEVGE